MDYWLEFWRERGAVTVVFTGADTPAHYDGYLLLPYVGDLARTLYLDSHLPVREL